MFCDLLSFFQIYPLWLSPNLITFVGWLFTVSNFVILGYFDWDFIPHYSNPAGMLKVPSYIWMFCAVSQFLSHTLDGTDGKQARRTQSRYDLYNAITNAKWHTLFHLIHITF